MRIDKLVEGLDDVPPVMLAKIKIVDAVDSLLEAIDPAAAKSAMGRIHDLLGGHWSAESKKWFIEANHY